MSNKTEYVVKKTTEYDIFNIINANRNINPRHVKTLKGSFREHGVLMNPILVNDKMQVVDGQHRLTALKQLELPVYYLIIGDYGIKEVQALNLNQKNWSKKDYAVSFSEMGYEHYTTLLEFHKEYDEFGFTSCIKLLQNSTTVKDVGRKNSNLKRNTTEETNPSQVFEEGTWEVSDYDIAEEWVEYLRNIDEYYSGYNRSVFVSTMIGLFKKPQFDRDEFMRKLSYQGNALNDCTSISDYLLLIEEIYNFKKRNKVNLRY